MEQVFVLLDDCQATAGAPTSRLYSGFVREHRCTDPRALHALWQAVEQDQRAGLHAALFADYEWGCKLQNAGIAALAPGDGSALRVLMFASLQHLSNAAVAAWLQSRDGSERPSPAGVSALQPTITPERFDADIARIRELIRRGETYQVNYTLRMRGTQFGSPVGLYRRLREMQPVAFGALAALPVAEPGTGPDTTPGTAPAATPVGVAEAAGDCVHWVLSASPELFVQSQNGKLTARPMKGTSARNDNQELDRQQARWLSQDIKNRAENVMIVDLLRNDLGRICEIGSVKVTSLFSVETYKTVHQMTSTIEARARQDVAFPDVLRALFPCGSITGAPKLHTMDWIAKLESTPRGLYCGAIGWVDAAAADQRLGDFCLSVAIRTLSLGAAQAGLRPMTLGLGSGVVLDSEAPAEFAETYAKARFLTAMDPGFTLFETLRVRAGRACHLRYHLERLRNSADQLGFRLDLDRVNEALARHLATLSAAQNYRLRLDLRHDGSISLQHQPLAALPAGPQGLVLSAVPVPESESALLNHKTSLRSTYDAAIQSATARGAFDTVFVNPQGNISEGARSTVLVQLHGEWFTPPLISGVLAGVMRRRLLQRCRQLREREISLEEALDARQLLVCSALRGVLPAYWMKDAQGALIRV